MKPLAGEGTGTLAALLLALLPVSSVAGEARGTVASFESPGGVVEVCVRLPPMPGGRYSAADRREEAALCGIDFHAGTHALCPKFFSTSAGTLIYDISSGRFTGDPAAFEAARCGTARIFKKDAAGAPIAYKMTMNARGTSATFAPASLLYYHFSRYFQSNVYVPPSVWRSMDRQIHFDRVVARAQDASAGEAMNRAAWEMLAAGARDPSSYRPTSELYTDDRRQIFGVMLNISGRRYGAEVNGTRRSGWGAGQSRDFQKTAPFRALRMAAPLAEAVRQGVSAAMEDPELAAAMGAAPSDVQVAFWMQDIVEIVLLDYVFSQQDRVGNIDYLDFWYWIADGELKRMPAQGTADTASVPDRAMRIRRTVLNDNDAAGRVPYANFAKTTNMLGGLRHFPPETYRRLQALSRDLSQQGPIYAWLAGSFGLSGRQVEQVVRNASMVAALLKKDCESGRLLFDLRPELLLSGSEATPVALDCNAS